MSARWRSHRVASLALAFVCATALTGCLSDPYHHAHPTSAATPAGKMSATSAASSATPESEGTTAGGSPLPAASPPLPHPGPRASAAQALRDFAQAWIDWSWRDVAAQQRVLASMATGTLAATLSGAAAAEGARAAKLASRPSASGTVELAQVRGGAGSLRGLVLTREISLEDGRALAGGEHWGVYEARLAHTAAGWLVLQWNVLQ